MISILDVEDNPTGEDYLLNFDYLHGIGTVSDEQYDYVPTYCEKIKEYNQTIREYSDKIAVLESQRIDVEAARATAETAMALDCSRRYSP